MTAREAITVLEIELTKAQRDFYPDRRNALREAIRVLKREIIDEDIAGNKDKWKVV